MLEFLIPDMTCNHCASVIKKALLSADPTARIDIQLPTHQVKVETQLDQGKVLALLDEAGYQAKSC